MYNINMQIENLNYENYDRNSLIDISKLIVEAIAHYQKSISEEDIQNSALEAEQYAIGQVMRLCKGYCNSNTIKDMIKLENRIWQKGTMRQC